MQGSRGTNKWYSSRTSAVVGLTAGDDERFGDVRQVSSTSWSTLTRTNYEEWSVTMKVQLRARRLWNAVDKGTDNEEDDPALEDILAAVPAEYRASLGAKSSAKEAWEAIAAMRVGSNYAKKATA